MSNEFAGELGGVDGVGGVGGTGIVGGSAGGCRHRLADRVRVRADWGGGRDESRP